MRRVILISTLLVVSLGSNAAIAGPRVVQVPPADSAAPSPTAGFETYKGYSFNLAENSERKDLAVTTEMLRRQLDTVESVGFSPRVLRFFRTVPIIANEMACLEEGAAAACYGVSLPERKDTLRGVTTWDNETHKWSNPDPVELAADSGVGVIMLRPNMMRYEKDPVMLHEFLHAYHSKLMPQGYENRGIKNFFAEASSKNLFPKEAYVLKNNREFFAVTASIFLVGKDSVHEPFTRAKLKEQMPGYYKYLVGVFGFDPEGATVTPVASAN